jgi:L-ascorbate metabolism protein UlaG (beta-lactamase superfamily)
MLEYSGIRIDWFGHDAFRIVADKRKREEKIIYIDPYQLKEIRRPEQDANIVLISHNHFDHLSINDLKAIINKNTSIVAAQECIEKLNHQDVYEVRGVKPGDRLTIQSIPIEIVPAYNTNKDFHPKVDNKIGFVITVNDIRIYHAGDTDIIQEMQFVNPDIALVPVSGTYVMTAEEAAKATNELIKPKRFAIPMHYGAIVGSERDAHTFKKLVRVCETMILDRH